ncbi:hypothetical protein K501DRAFT_38161 [Backusella circina FSU 941]|nr:hypothetical protein K501DRAFT_38161 [Backusella circina FSU 941]
MFGDHDEKELELLRMYDAEQDEGSNSDTSEGLDSDEENKILSVLNYQSNFDAVKPVTNQSAIHTSNQTLKKPVQQTKYDKLLPTGSDSLEHKETKGVSNGKMAANSTIDKQEVIVNYIDMNAQIEVQEKPKESNSVERNRKLQTLINKGIEQASFDQRRPERLCSTCFSPDHQAMDCKRCYICGGPKHTTSTCVGLEYCKRCKRRGHNEKDCEDRYRDRDCNICKVEYHRSQECPSLLHRYDGVMPPAEEMASYCYHCAESGHYGDVKYLRIMDSKEKVFILINVIGMPEFPKLACNVSNSF